MSDFFEEQRICPIGSFPYTIKAGDTLFRLARIYNTTVEDIIDINPGIDPNNLQIGQVICIPTAMPPIPPCPNGFYYTIKAGDTFFSIGRRFGVSVEALMRANPGVDPNNLQIGQIICVPRAMPPVPPCPNGFYYTIKAGDTLFSIGQRFGVSVEALMRANPGVDPNNLQIGQIICVPRAMPPPPPCPGGRIYTVKPGDNLGSIAIVYNVSLNDLISANPGFDPNRLVPGQQICIPPHKDRLCPKEAVGSYLITQKDIPSSGSTVVALAEKFVVSVSDLMRVNPNLAPSDFVVGVRICIPRGELV